MSVRRSWTVAALVGITALGAAASSSAATLALGVPPSGLVEGDTFSVAYAGDVTGVLSRPLLLDIYRAPAAPGLDCPPGLPAPASWVRLVHRGLRFPVFNQADHTPIRLPAGAYLLCGYVSGLDGANRPVYATASAIVLIDAPVRWATLTGPGEPVAPSQTFKLHVDWFSIRRPDMQLALTALPDCPPDPATLLVLDPAAWLAQGHPLASGSTDVTVALPRPGMFTACAYLSTTRLPGAAYGVYRAERQVIVAAPAPSGPVPTAASSQPTVKRCGTVAGSPELVSLRATGTSCADARTVARRWRRAGRGSRVGAYSCRTRRTRVTCTSGRQTVTFVRRK
jgi:hypothetical protein